MIDVVIYIYRPHPRDFVLETGFVVGESMAGTVGVCSVCVYAPNHVKQGLIKS